PLPQQIPRTVDISALAAHGAIGMRLPDSVQLPENGVHLLGRQNASQNAKSILLNLFSNSSKPWMESMPAILPFPAELEKLGNMISYDGIVPDNSQARRQVFEPSELKLP